MTKKKGKQYVKKHALIPEMKKRKWKKGESGNPNGRPKGSGLTDLLLKEIEKIHPTDKDKKTWKQLIVEATMRLAIKGNAAALHEIWERIDGKVMLPIGGDEDHPVSFIFNNVKKLPKGDKKK